MGAVKTIFRMLCALLVPAAMTAIFYFVMPSSSDLLPPLVLLHLLTVAWAALYLIWRPARISVLPLSFLVALMGPYFYEMQHPELFQYFGTLLIALVYALPWAFVSFCVAVVVLVRERRKGRMIDIEL